MSEVQKSGSKVLKIVIGIVIAVLIIGGVALAYMFKTKNNSQSNDTSNTNSAVNITANNQVSNSTQDRVAPSGMKVYANTDFGFTLLYPETWPLEAEKTVEKIGSNNLDKLNFHLYRPDIKKDETIFSILFMKKDNANQTIQEYLEAHFNRPSKTSWESRHTDFAGGSDGMSLANFDDMGQIGNLPTARYYYESPDQHYVVLPVYPQDQTKFLTDIFSGTSYTGDDVLNSLRWK